MSYKPYVMRPWDKFNETIKNNENLENLNAYNNGYYEYLIGGGKKTPGNVNPTVAPALTDSEQLAEWAAIRGYTPAAVAAPEYKAATTPEMSYADYLKRTGMDGATRRQYDATVRSAEADYAKGKATYGQKAETLGRRGLTGSGYGDYLTGASFAAMQNAKVAAADTKALADADIARGYGEYLAGVQQANAQAEAEAYNANIKAQTEAENANAQAAADAEAYNKQQFETERTDVQSIIADGVSKRLTDEEILFRIQAKYGNAFDGSVSSWINNSRTALQSDIENANNETATARANEAYSIYDSNIGSMSGTELRQKMAVEGYSESEINAAAEKFSSDFLQRYKTAINLSSATLESLPTNKQIDDMVTLGQLTEADASTLKADVAARRGAVIKDEIKALADSESETATADIENLFKQIDKLDSAELSDADRSELYAMRTDGYINTVVDDDVKEPVTALLQAGAAMGLTKSDANAAAREGFVDKMSETIKVSINGTGSITISMGENEKGKSIEESIALSVVPNGLKRQKEINEILGVPDTKNDKRVFEGVDRDEVIKVYEGQLYMWTGSAWMQFSGVEKRSVGGNEKNAQLLYDILVAYYS